MLHRQLVTLRPTSRGSAAGQFLPNIISPHSNGAIATKHNATWPSQLVACHRVAIIPARQSMWRRKRLLADSGCGWHWFDTTHCTTLSPSLLCSLASCNLRVATHLAHSYPPWLWPFLPLSSRAFQFTQRAGRLRPPSFFVTHHKSTNDRYNRIVSDIFAHSPRKTMAASDH